MLGNRMTDTSETEQSPTTTPPSLTLTAPQSSTSSSETKRPESIVPNATPTEGRILVECCNGEILEIETAIAKMSVALRKRLENLDSQHTAIQLENITARALTKVMEYCHVHTTFSLPPSSSSSSIVAQGPLDLKAWDEKFVKLDPGTLCELASAAYHLEIKPLVDLTCQAIAQLLKGKSPAEIRRTFNILYDFNPEDDAPPPTMRDKLRNKLCNPKRKKENNGNFKDPTTSITSMATNNCNINSDNKDIHHHHHHYHHHHIHHHPPLPSHTREQNEFDPNHVNCEMGCDGVHNNIFKEECCILDSNNFNNIHINNNNVNNNHNLLCKNGAVSSSGVISDPHHNSSGFAGSFYSSTSNSLISEKEEDTRSVDDLVSFINHGAGVVNSGSGGLNKSKNVKRAKQRERRKNRKRALREQKLKDDELLLNNNNQNLKSNLRNSHTDLKKSEAKKEEKYDDEEEDIDPEVKAHYDREVEEFRRRLERINNNNGERRKISLPSTLSNALIESLKKN